MHSQEYSLKLLPAGTFISWLSNGNILLWSPFRAQVSFIEKSKLYKTFLVVAHAVLLLKWEHEKSSAVEARVGLLPFHSTEYNHFLGETEWNKCFCLTWAFSGSFVLWFSSFLWSAGLRETLPRVGYLVPAVIKENCSCCPSCLFTSSGPYKSFSLLLGCFQGLLSLLSLLRTGPDPGHSSPKKTKRQS